MLQTSFVVTTTDFQIIMRSFENKNILKIISGLLSQG